MKTKKQLDCSKLQNLCQAVVANNGGARTVECFPAASANYQQEVHQM